MKKCNCRHLGNCPTSKHVHPLARTYPDGAKVFRQLTVAEKLRADKPELGDQVSTEGHGDVVVVAKAIDPDKAEKYARSMVGKKCKADSYIWRKTHPVPEEDMVVTAGQVPSEEER